MTLTIEVPIEVERNLSELAQASGSTPEAIVTDLIQRRFANPHARTNPRPWQEVVAPVAAEFAASGMSEEDLDVLIEEAREEIYFEKHGRRSKLQ